jgi:adenosylcobinamide-phosphate synthase
VAADGGGIALFICIAGGEVCVALAIDRRFGEPPARWHPVVSMGRYLGAMGRRIAPVASMSTPERVAHDLPRFLAGALAWLAGAGLVVACALAVDTLARRLPSVVDALLIGVALKPLLAWRLLRDEVAAVEQALTQSLDAGRARLAHLVSRDVDRLDAHAVRESAIESLAENLNDSLVAPLFWFALLGLPGAALYRFANTADAMWGYRGSRDGRDWTWAGKWAARADDVLSWLPARLTAALLRLCTPASWRAGFGALKRDAAATPSPNSGWPMAAMALALGVRLGKPGVYVLNCASRVPEAADTQRALRLGQRVVNLVAMVSALVAVLGLLGVRSTGVGP